MAHDTAEPTELESEEESTLPDIITMRESTSLALDDELPEDQLVTLIVALRGHMRVLMPEVATLAGRQPKDSIPRYVAIACLDEARRKLRMGDGGTLPVRQAVARKLARSLNALCDHYQNLGGAL